LIIRRTCPKPGLICKLGSIDEWNDDAGQWWLGQGNENGEFDEHGYMAKRYASINDQPMTETDRKFRWERK